ncbi:E3 ubiquitin-protein ligase ZSWIM2 [Polypterus senegalus]|uniref:E3 ubiquitin-protein ligase ZSWIM2 n=1 Tax=Polypterus senegalus TaxID=55291 RepID=UPI001963C6B6|nr:E3 ubiquitin-protein ligase ZSWIM2 [Polypterus senegalus]
MSRSSTWRRSPSDAASWHQDEALRATIFLLRELGPTRFVLREEGESRSVTVSLGDPHTCSCPVFQREKDLCKHVCWVLLKKFQLPRENDYAFQLGLVEREISQLLLGAHRARTPRVTPKCSEQKAGGDGLLQKKIDPEDVCPVCQEVLLQKRLPVSYCRYGCGNSVHITCMKVWAEHQATADRDAMVKCPLCREDFAPLKLLLEEVRNSSKLMSRAEKERQDRHLGIVCQGCQVCPVVGKCFRCTACSGYYLCEPCFQKRCHPLHSFTYRLKRNQQWTLVDADPECQGLTTSPPESAVTPEQVVQALPQMKVAASSKLLEPGWQCRLCLNAFCVGQRVRRLPCNHKFHTSCIDQWLTSTSSSCPLDGQEVCTPPTWAQPNNGEESRAQQDLFVPGRGLLLGSPAGGQRASKRLVKPREMAGQHHAGQEGLCQGLRGVALCVEVLPPGRRHSRECRQ